MPSKPAHVANKEAPSKKEPPKTPLERAIALIRWHEGKFAAADTPTINRLAKLFQKALEKKLLKVKSNDNKLEPDIINDLVMAMLRHGLMFESISAVKTAVEIYISSGIEVCDVAQKLNFDVWGNASGRPKHRLDCAINAWAAKDANKRYPPVQDTARVIAFAAPKPVAKEEEEMDNGATLHTITSSIPPEIRDLLSRVASEMTEALKAGDTERLATLAAWADGEAEAAAPRAAEQPQEDKPYRYEAGIQPPTPPSRKHVADMSEAEREHKRSKGRKAQAAYMARKKALG